MRACSFHLLGMPPTPFRMVAVREPQIRLSSIPSEEMPTAYPLRRAEPVVERSIRQCTPWMEKRKTP